MAFLIGGANSAAADAAYSIDNSCCFNAADSAYMHRTLGTPTDVDKWTFSCWLKRGNVSTAGAMKIFNAYVDGNGYHFLAFAGNAAADELVHYDHNTSVTPADIGETTTGSYRDPSAWMHLVVIYDSDNATAANRSKLFVNGVEPAATITNPGDGANSIINTAIAHQLGAVQSPAQYFDGYMAEVIFFDGQAYDADELGEYNSDSPTIWQPKDPSNLTFSGTNTFWLDFEDSADLGKDVSGQGNHFTEVNFAATDQSTDTPTLNYPTLSPLVKGSYATLSQGNLHLNGNTASDGGSCYATIPFPKSGKWYLEEKMTDQTGQMPESGIQNDAETSNFQTNLNSSVGMPYKTNGSSINCSGNIMLDGSSSISIDSIADGAIKQFAIDMDNGAVYFGLNNTWYNSGDPESGGSRTGAIDTWTAGTRLSTVYGTTGYNGSDSETNFGAPRYANSSDAADANGHGAFEYAPPSGYFALNSKNIAEFG